MSNQFEIRFVKLPFYDVIYELLKPLPLAPQNVQSDQQTLNFMLNLTPNQVASILSGYRSQTGQYHNQILMRFCLIDRTKNAQFDYLPTCLVIRINGKQCPLPVTIQINYF